MRRIVLALAALAVAGGPVVAQQRVDPRLAEPLIMALQGQVALAQATVKVMQEDQAKKDAELAEWFKAWFGEHPPVAEAKPAQ